MRVLTPDTQRTKVGMSKKTVVPWRAVTHHHTLVNFANLKKNRNTFLEECLFSAERREDNYIDADGTGSLRTSWCGLKKILIVLPHLFDPHPGNSLARSSS